MTEPEITPPPPSPAAAPRLTAVQKLVLVVLVLALAAGGYFVVADGKKSSSPAPAASASHAGAPAAAPAAAATVQTPSDPAMQQFLLQHYRGEVTSGAQAKLVARVGETLATRGDAKESKKTFRFHLLAEPNIINSFAVPTGDVYVTVAMVNRMKTEGQLAAILAGGIAHAMANDHMTLIPPAKLQFTAAQETAADTLTVKLMSAGGYDPQALFGVFQVLTDAYNAHADVVFFATHLSAEGRLYAIDRDIKTLYPQGVPTVMSK